MAEMTCRGLNHLRIEIMKSFLDVEKNRIAYHENANKNTVHRSSLIVPQIDRAQTNISFLNHFLIKRNYKEVALKITALNSFGQIIDSLLMEINEPKVYSINLDNIFEARADLIREYLVEFYSEKNLFIPFPAVMVNHMGKDFLNSVHSFSRVLNDIFENDSVNRNQVYESSIRCYQDAHYDTFFNFASGPFKPKSQLEVRLETEYSSVKKVIPIDMERLSNKTFYLSEILDSNNDELTCGVLKILQPQQDLFYGRLLAGIIHKKTGSFTANHSYYDSSTTKEYFDNNESRRTYPYFKNFINRIAIYPIMSPSILSVGVEFKTDSGMAKSETLQIRSPSNLPIFFDVSQVAQQLGLSSASAFEVVATAIDGNVPSRVNHQLLYGMKDSISPLLSSINVSLLNKQIFALPYKTGFTWGQMVVDEEFVSYIGICFNESLGKEDEIEIDLYNEGGLFKTINYTLNPGSSLIISSEDLRAEV